MTNKWKKLALLCCLFLLIDLAAFAQQHDVIEITLERSGTVVNGTIYDEPPENAALVARSRAFLAAPKQGFVPQVDSSWTPGPPANPEVTPFIPETLAPGDYEQIENSNLNPTNNTSVIDEPSLAQAGRTILYTGNWFAGFSGDYGQTWSYYNPYDNFPPNGVADQPAGSSTFCCDQVSTYDDEHNAFFWFLQYIKNGSTAASS